MANGLYLLAAKPRHGTIESVQFGIGAYTEVVVIDIVETIQSITLYRIALGVPGLHHLVRICTVGKVETGRNVNIVQHVECCVDGHLMAHTVTPVLNQVALEKQVFLRVDAIGKRSGIAGGNLLIPAFLSRHLLAFERIELAERDVQGGQRQGNAAVAHILAQVEGSAQCQTDIVERLAVRDTTGSGTLRKAFRIVHTGQVVTLVTAGGKVHTGRETLGGIGLGILTVAPCNLEALAHIVVGHVLLALLAGLVAEIEATAETITLLVVGLRRNTPRTLGVDFAQHFGIEEVAHGKIISSITQVKASGGLIAISGHDDTAGITAGEGEESVRNGQRKRHITDNQTGGAENNLLARAHLGSCHGQIKVGILCIASGIASFLHIHYAGAVSLSALTHHKALALFGVDIGDVGLSRLEVIVNLVGFVLVLSLFEQWLTFYGTCTVRRSRGMHQTAVHTHRYAVGRKFKVGVCHLT